MVKRKEGKNARQLFFRKQSKLIFSTLPATAAALFRERLIVKGKIIHTLSFYLCRFCTRSYAHLKKYTTSHPISAMALILTQPTNQLTGAAEKEGCRAGGRSC